MFITNTFWDNYLYHVLEVRKLEVRIKAELTT